MKFKKLLLNYWPLILILLLASILRFLWLDKVPNAIGGDELTYIVNARAMFLTGTDISGTWNPLTGLIFQYPAYTLPQAELPYFLISPFVGIFGFSIFWARVPFVLLSVGSVLLIFLITKALFNEKAALATSFIAAINPWSIYIGRTSYESTPAVFFFLLSLYALLVLKSKKILLTIPILFLAFYSYVGTKVSFIPFVIIVLLYSYFFVNKKKYLKEYLIVLTSCLILVAFFAFSVFTTSGPSRAGELISFNSPQIAKEVDSIRKTTMESPLKVVFENKFTVFSRIVFTKLIKSFSFDYLFISGDQFYSNLRHGFFYILDALFLVLGFAFAYSLRKKSFFLIFSIALIGVLPQILYSNKLDNFSVHLSLMFAVLPIFIGVGISESVNLFKNKFQSTVSLVVIVALYFFLFFNFLNIYFYQFPLGGYFDFQVRVLSKYLVLANNENVQIAVYTPSTPDIFKKYIFYSNSYDKDTYLAIRKNYKSANFKFNNIEFRGCDNTIDASAKKEIIVYDSNCGSSKEVSHLAIPRLSDGGESYKIYNDKVCSAFNLKRYPEGLKISDFAIEMLSNKDFCQTFITSF